MNISESVVIMTKAEMENLLDMKFTEGQLIGEAQGYEKAKAEHQPLPFKNDPIRMLDRLIQQQEGWYRLALSDESRKINQAKIDVLAELKRTIEEGLTHKVDSEKSTRVGEPPKPSGHDHNNPHSTPQNG